MKKKKNARKRSTKSFWIYLKDEYFLSLKKTISKLFAGVVGFDLVFYALFFVFALIFNKFSNTVLAPIQKIALTSEYAGVPMGSMPDSQAAVIKVFGLFIVLLILLVFSWGVSRGLIWSWLTKKAITAKTILKIMLSNLVWFILWTIPFFVIGKGIYDSYISGAFLINPKPSMIALGIFFFVFAYFSYIYYYIIANKQNIFSSIGAALRLGLTRFTELGIPLLVGIITLAVLFFALEIFRIFPKFIQLGAFYIFLFGGLSWLKIYAADVFNRVLKDDIK